jgi:hypothetical protein
MIIVMSLCATVASSGRATCSNPVDSDDIDLLAINIAFFFFLFSTTYRYIYSTHGQANQSSLMAMGDDDTQDIKKRNRQTHDGSNQGTSSKLIKTSCLPISTSITTNVSQWSHKKPCKVQVKKLKIKLVFTPFLFSHLTKS